MQGLVENVSMTVSKHYHSERKSGTFGQSIIRLWEFNILSAGAVLHPLGAPTPYTHAGIDFFASAPSKTIPYGRNLLEEGRYLSSRYTVYPHQGTRVEYSFSIF